MAQYPFEPYKIKVVEPINITTKEEREALLKNYGYNLFAIPAKYITIDLLTDSGTSAMSQNQWAGIMVGDESYAGCHNYFHLESVVKEITGYKEVIPVHQGRAGENLLFSILIKPNDLVPNNTHFDTTAANVAHKGGISINIPVSEGLNPDSPSPFKGNMDIEKLENLIKENGPQKIPLCIITVTNNSLAGQPVSMENIREVSKLVHNYGIPLFFDAARYAENAYFIKTREKGYENKTISEIAKEMFALGDGCLMSAKKDGLVNIGGIVALNDKELAQKLRELMVIIEGFPTYGGLSGRDLEAMAIGLKEAQDENYLKSRIEQVKYLADLLTEEGIPIYQPPGGHAVYINAKKFLPHIPQSQFPGQALVVHLYLEAGIRAVEVGSVMFSKKDPVTGKVDYPPLELVRLAIPRRVYTRSHLDYVAEAIINIYKRRDLIRGMKYVYEPQYLKHFLARFDFV